MKRYLLLGVFLLGLLNTYSQDGSLDPSFASRGWTTTSFFKGAEKRGGNAKKVFVQADGKYIAVIQLSSVTRLARYHADGTLDLEFGTEEGFSDPVEMETNSAVIQSDGKIVVAGDGYNETNLDLVLTRFNSNGTLDLTFGTNGKVISDFGGDEEANDVALQSSGKMLVTGNFGNADLTVARYNSNGTPDLTFGTNGKVISDFGGDEYAYAIAVDGSDNFVVAGSTYSFTTFLTQFAVARFTADGTQDMSFDGDGMITNNVGGMTSWATSIAIQSDGKIIAAGQANNYDHLGYDFALVRYTASGSLDGSFGLDGITITNLSTTDLNHSADKPSLILGNGTIIVGGTYIHRDADNNTVEDFAVVRYVNNGTNDGTVDPSFGTNGITITNLDVWDILGAVAVQSDGKIIAAGEAYSYTTDYFPLVRYTTVGSLDESFNGTGILQGYYTPEGPSALSGIAVQKDNKIVVAGFGINPANLQSFYLGLARYNPDGSLDGNFGTGGKVTTDFGENLKIGNLNQLVSVAIQSDGKIVAGLQVENTTTGYGDIALARFTAAGTLDGTFDNDGKVTTDFGGYVQIGTMAIQNDGRIVVAGYFNNSDFTLVRYTATGALDNSFGTGGKVTTDFYGGEDNSWGVAIQSDGKIVAVGSATNAAGNYDFALARYTTSGRLDNTFGNRGKVTSDFGSDDQSGPLVIQGDGKIVVLGLTSDNTGSSNFALARYNANGSLDNTFDNDGKVNINFGAKENISSITLQSDGKILVAGTVEDLSTFTYYLTLARYTTSGGLDNDFDNDGKATTSLSGEYYYSINWNNGRIYAVGRTLVDYNDAGLLAAFKGGSASTLPVVNIDDTKVSSVFTATTATLTISATGTISSPITVNYATQDGTATSKGRNADYKTIKGAVVLSSTVSSATISIPVNASAFSNGVKYFNVNLSLSRQMSSLATIGDGTGVVTIIPPPMLANPVTRANNMQGQEAIGKLSVNAYPNPSSGLFTLQLQSAGTEPLTMYVTDVSGRIIETRTNIVANGSLQLGSLYHPGVYYVQVVQGSDKVMLNLVKQ
jgi:uncharacterized delta-60 repeat protein